MELDSSPKPLDFSVQTFVINEHPGTETETDTEGQTTEVGCARTDRWMW